MRAEERDPGRLGLARGHSVRTMATVLGRAHSPVSRELARNTTRGRPLSGLYGADPRGGGARGSHGDCGNSSTPGGGSMCGRIWLRAARPNRLPDVSNARILTTCGNRSRPRPSRWAWRYGPAAPCDAHGWPRCVRRAQRVGLEREGPIDAAGFPT